MMKRSFCLPKLTVPHNSFLNHIYFFCRSQLSVRNRNRELSTNLDTLISRQRFGERKDNDAITLLAPSNPRYYPRGHFRSLDHPRFCNSLFRASCRQVTCRKHPFQAALVSTMASTYCTWDSWHGYCTLSFVVEGVH